MGLEVVQAVVLWWTLRFARVVSSLVGGRRRGRWLSVLFVNRKACSFHAAVWFVHRRVLDNTSQGLFMACLTAALGPLIEIGLVRSKPRFPTPPPPCSQASTNAASLRDLCMTACVHRIAGPERAQIIPKQKRKQVPLESESEKTARYVLDGSCMIATSFMMMSPCEGGYCLSI